MLIDSSAGITGVTNLKQFTITGIGEILWDMLPAGKKLGGAPANFAYHAAALGSLGLSASRIGKDNLGAEILDELKKLSLSAEFIQIDSDRPTGTVNVELSAGGQPSYEIVEDVAWDHLAWDEKFKELTGRTDAACFGSLAQRSKPAAAAIGQFLSHTRPDALRVYDVNLRQNYYSKELVENSISLANIVKLNEHELPIIAELLGTKGANQEEMAKRLLKNFNLQIICVTLGENGCLIISGDEVVSHPGFKVKVADTVGSGDAFTACMVTLYLRGTDLTAIARNANRYGSWVATQNGATPRPDKKILNEIFS